MTTKKIPMRMCTGCREMKPKRELIRIVRVSEDDIRLDTTGKLNGRGAYICKCAECLQKAKRSNALSRAFETQVSQDVYNSLERALSSVE